MASRFSLEAVISVIDNVTSPMKTAESSVLGFSKKMQGGFSAASNSSMGFGNIIKGILGANIIQSVAFHLKDMALRGIALASSLIEVDAVIRTTFGNMAGEVNDFAKTALKQFGLSELQAKQFAGTIGAMGKSAGVTGKPLVIMSTRLAALSGDLAAFRDLPIEEAFTKIRSGLSGETEPLKAIGVDVSVAALEEFAKAAGMAKKVSDMSSSEKFMLRYNLILSRLTDAQGAFNRELDTSYANQKRLFEASFDEFLAKIATQSMPLLLEGMKQLNAGLSKLDPVAIGQGIKSALDFTISLVQTFISLLPYIKAVILAYIAWRSVLLTIKILQAFVSAVEWINYLIEMRAVIMLAVKGHWLRVRALIAEKVALLANNAATLLLSVGLAAYSLMGTIATAITWALGAAFAFLTSPIGLVILAIIVLIGVGILVYQNWETIKAVGISVFNTLSQVFFSFAYAFTYVWFGIIDAVLSGAEKVGGALGMNVGKIQAIRQEMGSIQADIQSRSMFASPNSQGAANNNINGNINVNVSSPAGSNTETTTSGTFGGMKLNTGVDKG